MTPDSNHILKSANIREILGCIEIPEDGGGETRFNQLFFGDDAHLDFGEKGVEFVAALCESAIGVRQELSAVDCAEGVEMASRLGEGYGCARGFRIGDQELQEARVEEREIDGEDQVVDGRRACEGGVDSAQGTGGRVDVRDGGSECGEFFGIADDSYFGSDGAREIEGAGEQGLAIEFQKSFVGAHAGASASGEDEGGDGEHGEMIQGAASSRERGARAGRPKRLWIGTRK